jgi:hypothetical protein
MRNARPANHLYSPSRIAEGWWKCTAHGHLHRADGSLYLMSSAETQKGPDAEAPGL